MMLALLFALVSLSLGQSYVPPYPAEPQGVTGRSYAEKFSGPFNLINVTTPCLGFAFAGIGPYCLGEYAFDPAGVIGYWPNPSLSGRGTMSASLQHAIQPTDNLTYSTFGTFYAGNFFINPSGDTSGQNLFIWHQPICSSNPVAIPLDNEVRCFQFFNNDNLLRLFITTAGSTGCTGNVSAELYWGRINSFQGPAGSSASVLQPMILVLLSLVILL